MERAVFEGTNMVNAKGSNDIFDHGVKTRISVEQRAKALVFKKNRRSSPLEIARKCQISKVNCSMNMPCVHAVSVHCKQ